MTDEILARIAREAEQYRLPGISEEAAAALANPSELNLQALLGALHGLNEKLTGDPKAASRVRALYLGGNS